jgi:hypothetical protein
MPSWFVPPIVIPIAFAVLIAAYAGLRAFHGAP